LAALRGAARERGKEREGGVERGKEGGEPVPEGVP